MDKREIAASVLERAQKVVMHERGNEHGDAEDSFATIAAFWASLLSATNHREVHISGADVALMMTLLKVARSIHGNGMQTDHYVDMAGYASLAAMLRIQNAPKTAPKGDSVLSDADFAEFKPVKLKEASAEERMGLMPNLVDPGGPVIGSRRR
jgi:hypothetical protein